MARPRKNKNDSDKQKIQIALYGYSEEKSWEAWCARFEELPRRAFWFENRERLLKMWRQEHKDGTMPHDLHRYEGGGRLC